VASSLPQKGTIMKKEILNLGILLLMILLVILIGSLTLVLTNDINNLFGIGLVVILLLVIITFISYLLIDLRSSIEDEKEGDYRPSEELLKQK
jgi:hypothetical protein